MVGKVIRLLSFIKEKNLGVALSALGGAGALSIKRLFILTKSSASFWRRV
jgi:hypothetical protein